MEEEREAREIRRRSANWELINKLPPKLKKAIEIYIETGDVRRASKIAEVDLETFLSWLRAVNVPLV